MRRSSLVNLMLTGVLAASVTCLPRDGDATAEALARVVFIRADGARATLRVEIADEPGEIARGLMFRRSLPRDQGMLFVGESPGGFWMRNTLIPLSVAFLDAGGGITGIRDMRPAPRLGTVAYVLPDGTVRDIRDDDSPPNGAKILAYPPPGRHSYAIETNRGWFTRHRLTPGAHADLSAAIRH